MSRKNADGSDELLELVAQAEETPVTVPADLGDRAENAHDQAEQLRMRVDLPLFKQVNKREWRAHYWLDGHLYACLVTQVLGVPAGEDTRHIGNITAQLTGPHHHYPHALKYFTLTGNYDMLDLVAFLELDKLPAAAVRWHEITNYREVPTVEDLVARVATGLATVH